MILSEGYKKRLKELAGIQKTADDITDSDREEAFKGSFQRVPFSKDLMIQAIKGGYEIGMLFKTNNDKDLMPLAKYRTIFPVCLGTNTAGNEVVRAVHKIGQSESAARKTGKRSQNAYDEWRLFKTKNIKSMWFTGNMFSVPPKNYNAADKNLVSIEIAADFPAIKKYQDDLIKNAAQNQRPKPNIVKLFKEPEVQAQVPAPTTGTVAPVKNKQINPLKKTKIKTHPSNYPVD
jgi:hypothetical protein